MRRNRIAIVLIAINLTVSITLALFAYQQQQAVAQLTYARAELARATLGRFQTDMAELELTLQKTKLATSDEVAASLGLQLYGRAMQAKATLAKLQSPPEATAQAYVFLSETAALAKRFVRYGPDVRDDAAAVLAEIPHTSKGPEDALQTAAAFLGVRPEIFGHAGSCDTHRFRARMDGGALLVEVCAQSGKVVRAENARHVLRTTWSPEEGLAFAKTFLVRNGHDDMHARYWSVDAGIVTAEFFRVRDGVLFYPEHIQISIGLDNGRVTGFHLSEALQNPDEHAVPAISPIISPEGAMDALPRGFQLLGYDLAAIELYGSLILCYAFHGTDASGAAFLIYVSAGNGQQVMIRRLHEDEVSFSAYLA